MFPVVLLAGASPLRIFVVGHDGLRGNESDVVTTVLKSGPEGLLARRVEGRSSCSDLPRDEVAQSALLRRDGRPACVVGKFEGSKGTSSRLDGPENLGHEATTSGSF